MNTISKLSSQDLTEAYQLEKLCHPIPWSENTFNSNQGERYINNKITFNNTIIGFSICQVVVDEATLFNIAIHPNYRNQGLAKALLTHLIEQLVKSNIKTLWLEVRESNIAAINLYLSLGFNEITIRKNYYPTDQGREDAIIMAYTLSF